MTPRTEPQRAAVAGEGVSPSHPRLTPAGTTDDRLVQIQALGQRIDGYIQFMCIVDSLGGTSLEAKEKAVTVFHECLQALEQKLRRIQDNLRLE